MNFPVGEVVSKAYLPIDIKKVFEELENIKFNGYIIQSVKGKALEEGVLFFRDGKLSSCVVECLACEKEVKGDEAFSFFLNQTRGEGFFQTIKLSRTQVDLVSAFDEKILIRNKINLKDLPKLIPNSFEDKFDIQEDKEDILNKYGLNVLKG
jgi:hypothetical protein